jgi:CheY-like chemotaxis protein
MANDQERLEPVSILVVETDPRRRRWIEHAFSGGRYHLMTVASAKQGLQYLKRNRCDVVVMGGHLRAIVESPSGSLRRGGYIPIFPSS